MGKLNEAQTLRQALGIEIGEHYIGQRRASSTKKGPGRVHVSGTEKDKRIKPRPPMGFLRHQRGGYAGSSANLRREAVRALGRRQGIKAHKLARRSA